MLGNLFIHLNYWWLQTANATRWNSQLSMIRSILRIPKEKLDSQDTHHLTVYDRKIMEDLVEILSSLETDTHCVQDDQVVTSSMIIPWVRVLKSTIETLSRKYTCRFVVSLKASVNKRLSRYEDAFVLASALDPRFKLKWSTPSEYDDFKQKLLSKVDLKISTNPAIQHLPLADLSKMQNNEQAEESDPPPPVKKKKIFFIKSCCYKNDLRSSRQSEE